MKIINHTDKAIQGALARYIASRIGTTAGEMFGDQPFFAIGFASENSQLLGAVAFNNFVWPDVHIHQAGRPGWLTRQSLRTIFEYPFEQLECRHVTGLIPAGQARARDITERAGFRLEGILREAHKDGDLCVYGMTRDECGWIKKHGQISTKAA